MEVLEIVNKHMLKFRLKDMKINNKELNIRIITAKTVQRKAQGLLVYRVAELKSAQTE